MLNETLNATANFATTVANSSWNYLINDFYTRITDIFSAPFQKTGMLWMLIPLLATAVLLEFYFGRYKEEELGWNTAFGNALLLLFVSIDLFRHTYGPTGQAVHEAVFSGDAKIIIALVIFCFAALLMLIDFFHMLPKKIAYAVSSPIYINVMAMLGVIIVYSDNIPLDWTTLAACIALILLFTFLTYILYWIVPSYHAPLHRILTADEIEKYKKNR